MTEQTERLAQIRKRVEKITPGPWQHDRQPIGSGRLNTVSSGPLIDDGRPRFPVAERLLGRDGEFIAHAPDDIIYLLDLLAETDGQ